MTLTEALQMMNNPQGIFSQQMMQQLIQENPDKWQQTQSMFANKSREQKIAALRELYQSKGMDLDNVAKQYGVNL